MGKRTGGARITSYNVCYTKLLRSLEEIIALVNSIELRGNGYAFLATRDGKIVAHAKPDTALKPVGEVIAGFDTSLLQIEGERIVQRELMLDGAAKYVAISSVPGAEWVLCAVVDKTTILSPLRALLGVLALAGLIIAALGAMFASVITSYSIHYTKLYDAGHHVLAIDQRGHGLSDKPQHGYDFASVAGDVRGLIETLGLRHVILAGQSWGGNVALEVAARFPGLAAGYIFVDGGFRITSYNVCYTKLLRA